MGRLGRPGRVQQHHPQGRAVVRARRARHQGVPRRRLRPGAPLRHPRARHGLGDERHRAARRHPGVRRHVPGLLRLHAPGRPAGLGHAAAGDLRLDPRLDRPRRGRPDPPARRAPRRAARDPRLSRGPPRGRQRDRGRLEGGPGEPGRPGGPVPHPPERPDVPRAAPTASARTRAASPAAATSCSTPTGVPDVVLVATGSEVQLAVQAREELAAKDIAARVVSMPCREWFDAQDPGYRDTVLPPEVRARVSVEAGVAQGWREVVGDAGRIVSLEHYGASAQHTELFDKFGFTAAAVVSAAEDSIRAATELTAARTRTHNRHTAPLGGNHGLTTEQTRSPSCPPQESRSGWTTCPGSASRPATSPTSWTSKHVVGVTTNPTIFASALKEGERYDDQVAGLTRAGASRRGRHRRAHHRRRAQRLRRPAEGLRGLRRGRRPGVDRGAAGARLRHRRHDRGRPAPCGARSTGPTCSIKIPGTTEGMPAIVATLAEGISVNVTLIFGLDRYEQVMEAYLDGLEQAQRGGVDLSTLHSVASFFVSRVDTEVDKRLEKIGTDEALALRGKAAVANARLAFQRYEAGLRRRAVRRARRGRGPPAAPAVGLDRRQEPRLLRHALRRRPGHRRHRQHDAGEDDGRVRRPRRGRAATRSAAGTTRRRP